MEYKSVSVSPDSMIRPDLDLATLAGSAALPMLTIRIELVLRPVEFMALVALCGARNVRLISRKITDIQSLNDDLGKALNIPEFQDNWPTYKQAGVVGLWEYHCIAYFRGNGVLLLTQRNSVSSIFPEVGTVDADELVLNQLISGIYHHIFNTLYMKDKMLPVAEIPAYDCEVEDNSAVVRYIANGTYTIDCASISERDIEILKSTNNEEGNVNQLTIVARTNFIDFLDVYGMRSSSIEVLAHDPLYHFTKPVFSIEYNGDPHDLLVATNITSMEEQLTYVIRVTITDTTFDELENCNWYKPDNAIYEAIQYTLYQLCVFQ